MNAPYFADVADGPDGEAIWLTTKDNVRLRCVLWPLAEAKGTVFILPGRTEYTEKYGPIAADLAAMGYAALAIDWRGQGLADRIHDDPGAGHVDEFSDYQDDLAVVLKEAEARGLPRPWFMLAHSMGGCIGLRALMTDNPFAAAAFSAPMWGIQMSNALRPFATGLSALSRRVGLSHLYPPGQAGESVFKRGTFEDNTLTTDPATWDWMRTQVASHPELSLGGPSLHWLDEALKETRSLSLMPSPRTPVVTFLGTDEKIVDPSRIETRMAHWPEGELVVLDGLRHEVLMEPPEVRGPSMRKIVDLFDQHRA
ncbi:MAG: lysophospholipase [Rhodobacterales bacterium]|nr:MAG: lysophospholipase [Rhodobacterales bacterium]